MLCAIEDLEAEQDELESSGGGSMLGLLDTTPATATPKSIKRRASGATGGRSGLKLSRQTSKPTEPEAKKSPQTPLQSSVGDRLKRLRRNLSAETQAGPLSVDSDEPALAENAGRADRSRCNSVEGLETRTIASTVTSSPLSGEKRGTERITRRNSDLKLAESDSVHSEPVNSKDVSETIAEVDSGMATE